MRAFIIATLVLCASVAQAQDKPWQNMGREATPAEIKAWDIDVRPDFKGLPKGAGSVTKGMEVWEGKCASCHGIFGESNEVFSPLVGGTTANDLSCRGQTFCQVCTDLQAIFRIWFKTPVFFVKTDDWIVSQKGRLQAKFRHAFTAQHLAANDRCKPGDIDFSD